MNAPVRHINFLEEKPSAAKQAFSLSYFWIIVIIVALCLGGFGFAYLQKTRIAALQGELDDINAELERLRATQSKRDAKVLSTKAVKDVLNDPVLWSSLIKKITKAIPTAIKLREISGGITDSRALILRGSSSYLLPIFRFKENLENLAECEKAALVSVEQTHSED